MSNPLRINWISDFHENKVTPFVLTADSIAVWRNSGEKRIEADKKCNLLRHLFKVNHETTFKLREKQSQMQIEFALNQKHQKGNRSCVREISVPVSSRRLLGSLNPSVASSLTISQKPKEATTSEVLSGPFEVVPGPQGGLSGVSSVSPGRILSLVQFNVRSLINKFKGDSEDENVLLQFSNWKTAWENLVIDMKEMPGFTEAILFQKLKECLEEPALSLVSVFASCSPSAYPEAMKCFTELKNKSEECMEAWTAGRVENLSSFSSWLNLYKVRIPNSKAVDSPSTATSTFSVSIKANTCLLCNDDHLTSRWPKALGMSFLTLKEWCVSKGICFRCLKTSFKDHSCLIQCRWCQGSFYQSNHSPLTCPKNKFRTKPLQFRSTNSKNIPFKAVKRQAIIKENDFAKIAKIMGEQISQSITSTMNPKSTRKPNNKNK
ncbi:unnamed protein product [Lepeophtheirus salmonis]|uniref:(salmon louse) hypothetical protein n=1 Tax=Lepeophtheirus salmonis TaxID=72036 RepID=A0A7R8CCL7_LEPSM|nr:unnamed protein product [Lepeophtheirus salmonis]CAF2764886.1 unnamed protein product [Lepeophtheirus salmonis]